MAFILQNARKSIIKKGNENIRNIIGNGFAIKLLFMSEY